MTTARLELTRDRILAFRRHVGALDRRLPDSSGSLRQAAWAGLQDSMPRAALLSLHARVEGTEPTALDDPSLVQVWGPRYNAYVVSEPDRAVFTLGRLPDRGKRREIDEDLAARLHVFGPTTAGSFATWAGIPARLGAAALEALEPSLSPVRTPIGDAWIRAEDEAAFRDPPADEAAARLLPSGDAYTLLHGDDRGLLVPDEEQRAALWTPRVWPGAVLVAGDIVGTWRRAKETLTVEPWQRLSRADRDAVEAEATSMPLPGTTGQVRVHWEE